MKKLYEEPVIELIKFNVVTDVLGASNPTEEPVTDMSGAPEEPQQPTQR